MAALPGLLAPESASPRTNRPLRTVSRHSHGSALRRVAAFGGMGSLPPSPHWTARCPVGRLAAARRGAEPRVAALSHRGRRGSRADGRSLAALAVDQTRHSVQLDRPLKGRSDRFGHANRAFIVAVDDRDQVRGVERVEGVITNRAPELARVAVAPRRALYDPPHLKSGPAFRPP
jgi:hypothetical protein